MSVTSFKNLGEGRKSAGRVFDITQDKTDKIAYMFFVENMDRRDIAKKVKITQKKLNEILTGRTLASKWAIAVGTLIVNGHTVDRLDREELERRTVAGSLINSAPIEKEVVLLIRRRHADGWPKAKISREMGFSLYTVGAIVSNRAYREREYQIDAG